MSFIQDKLKKLHEKHKNIMWYIKNHGDGYSERNVELNYEQLKENIKLAKNLVSDLEEILEDEDAKRNLDILAELAWGGYYGDNDDDY